MRAILPPSLIQLAESCPFPLYLVGGSVRDFLCGKLAQSPDYDLCAPCEEEEFLTAATNCGFTIQAVYSATGTVKLSDGQKNGYEFTRFRSDEYVRGIHAPSKVCFTSDIRLDARRRDFCANAIYYDIKNAAFCDPLGGIKDVEQKILRTVAPAKKVFGEDGLRLLRLARFAAQTGFSPDDECLAGARENRSLIGDIVPERVFHELRLLLFADEKSGDRDAPYRGLCVLRTTRVLEHVLPELAAGDGMEQRKDFHAHDVLEHTFRCVRYAPPEVRWAALLHDVGKPFCMRRDGNFYLHADEGARIAADILKRLKAPKQLTEETALLVKYHMRDHDLAMRKGKIRLDIVKCYPFLEKLFALKQADFSACRDDMSPAPAVTKWKAALSDMRKEGAPCSIKELCVNGNDLVNAGVEPKQVGHVLNTLLTECALNGSLNRKEKLVKRVQKFITTEETPCKPHSS